MAWRSIRRGRQFIGNRKNALQLVRELATCGEMQGRPFSYFTQASVDLAERTELLDAMVAASFIFDEGIFHRQRDFIERATIPWAMVGMLQAPPTTALYDRMKAEGRLIEASEATTNFSVPNFRISMSLRALLQGPSELLTELYEPHAYFARALRSLEVWKTNPSQTVPPTPMWEELRVLASSMWTQGVRSEYRRAYWRFLATILHRHRKNPVTLGMALGLLVAAHHFVP